MWALSTIVLIIVSINLNNHFALGEQKIKFYIFEINIFNSTKFLQISIINRNLKFLKPLSPKILKALENFMETKRLFNYPHFKIFEITIISIFQYFVLIHHQYCQFHFFNSINDDIPIIDISIINCQSKISKNQIRAPWKFHGSEDFSIQNKSKDECSWEKSGRSEPPSSALFDFFA